MSETESLLRVIVTLQSVIDASIVSIEAKNKEISDLKLKLSEDFDYSDLQSEVYAKTNSLNSCKAELVKLEKKVTELDFARRKAEAVCESQRLAHLNKIGIATAELRMRICDDDEFNGVLRMLEVTP